MVFYKTKHVTTIQPNNVLLGTYPRERKIYVHTKICTWMFVAALFVITPKWKQPRCPSTGGWLNKSWYIHIVEYHTTKGSKLLIHATIQVNLQIVILSEKKKAKVTCCSIPFRSNCWSDKIIEMESRLAVIRSSGWGIGVCGYKTPTWETFVTMEMFHILAVSISIFWLWYTVAWEILSLGETEWKVHIYLWIVS